MVGTRQKGKLARVPHGTRIDLSGEESPPPTKRRLEVGSSSEKRRPSAEREEAALLLGLKEKPTMERETEEEEKGNSEHKSEEEPLESEEPEEEEEEEEQEKEEEQEEEEEEQPAKRARTPITQRRVRTPTQEGKLQWSDIKARPGTEKRSFVVPSRVDFDALKELEVKEEVRGKFASIGWERFLEFSTDVYVEEEEVHSIEYRLGGIIERMSPNTINCELGVTPLPEMVTPEFHRAVKQFPALSKTEANEMWALVARDEPFSSDSAKEGELRTPAFRIYHRILAFNLFGKKNSVNTISHQELYILWTMETGKRLNFGYLMVGQLSAVEEREADGVWKEKAKRKEPDPWKGE